VPVLRQYGKPIRDRGSAPFLSQKGVILKTSRDQRGLEGKQNALDL